MKWYVRLQEHEKVLVGITLGHALRMSCHIPAVAKQLYEIHLDEWSFWVWDCVRMAKARAKTEAEAKAQEQVQMKMESRLRMRLIFPGEYEQSYHERRRLAQEKLYEARKYEAAAAEAAHWDAFMEARAGPAPQAQAAPIVAKAAPTGRKRSMVAGFAAPTAKAKGRAKAATLPPDFPDCINPKEQKQKKKKDKKKKDNTELVEDSQYKNAKKDEKHKKVKKHKKQKHKEGKKEKKAKGGNKDKQQRDDDPVNVYNLM